MEDDMYLKSNAHPGSQTMHPKKDRTGEEYLTAHQMAWARAKLCGMSGCCCTISAYTDKGCRLHLESCDGEGGMYIRPYWS